MTRAACLLACVLAVPWLLALGGCHASHLVASPPPADGDQGMPTSARPVREAIPVSEIVAEPSRLRRASPLVRCLSPVPPHAASSFASTPARRGRALRRLRASVAVRAPDALDVGVYFAVNRRLTVGMVGQFLEQERSVVGGGQLVDPNDLNSFISEFRIEEETTSFAAGPFVQLEVFRERGWRPQAGVAAFAFEWGSVLSTSTSYSAPGLIVRKDEDAASSGERADRYQSVYAYASKSLPLPFRSSLVRGLRAYGGAGYGRREGKRYATAQTGAGDPRIRVVRKTIIRHSFVGWAGAEVKLPRRLALYGEVFTGDECELGVSAGLRWYSPLGIFFTVGISDCMRSASQRALDLVYLPGGVGGQPSVVSGGSGLSGGGLGHLSPLEDDDEG